MFTCRQIYDLITEYDEGFLTTNERRQFEAHVVLCPPCRGVLSQMRATRDGLAHDGHDGLDELSPELSEKIVNAFRTWKQQS